jgi:hypothetical protein
MKTIDLMRIKSPEEYLRKLIQIEDNLDLERRKLIGKKFKEQFLKKKLEKIKTQS